MCYGWTALAISGLTYIVGVPTMTAGQPDHGFVTHAMKPVPIQVTQPGQTAA